MSNREQTIRRGSTLLQRRDYAAAASVLEPLCAGTDKVDEATPLLAAALSSLGDTRRASELYQRYLQVKPDNPEVWYSLGNHLKARQPEQAAAAFHRALELRPTFPDALYGLAICQHRLGQQDMALKTLDRLASLSDHPREQELRGVVLLALRRDAEAKQCFQHYTSLRPDNPSGKLNLAIAQRRLGEREAALDTLATAGGKAPAFITRERAAILMELGRRDEALAFLNALVEAAPLDLEAHDMIDAMGFESGRQDDIGQSLRRAYDSTRDPRLLGRLAQRLERLGQHQAALDTLQSAPDAAASDPDSTRLEGRLHSRLGQAEKAVETFRRGLQRFGDHRDLCLDFCRLELGRGQLDAAADLINRVLRRAPLDQEAWSYLCTVYKLAGDARYDWLCDYDHFVGEQELLGEGLDEAWLAQLADTLRALHVTREAPMDQTLRGGTQTSGALFNRPEPIIRELADRLRVLVQRHVASLPDDPRHPLLHRKADRIDFVGSWSVRLREQGFHINHNHRNGWFSSALYVALPEGIDRSSGAGCLQLGQSNLGLGDADRPDRLIVPTPGKLALFPSYLWHGTVPFHDGEERLTVAFDVAPAHA